MTAPTCVVCTRPLADGAYAGLTDARETPADASPTAYAAPATPTGRIGEIPHVGSKKDHEPMSAGWTGGSDTRWRTFRAGILKRDRYLCRINAPGCTTTAPLQGGHVDHIVPLAMGGAKYDPANCRAACGSCNTSRRVKVAEEPEPRRISSW